MILSREEIICWRNSFQFSGFTFQFAYEFTDIHAIVLSISLVQVVVDLLLCYKQNN